MEMIPGMNSASLRRIARTAGILYIVIIVSGLFSEMFVRSSLIVAGDAAATARNIANSQLLFRTGFASDLVMIICDIGIALAFYLLLKPVNNALALLAAFFRLVQASILGINMLNHFTALLLLDGTDYLRLFDEGQINALVMLVLNMHAHGYLISGVFFSFSLAILGYLVVKSGYIPGIFGLLLLFAAFSYLVDSFSNFLAPGLAAATEWLVVVSAVIAELSFCLWLLTKGVRKSALKS
jgi:hypothetical protein